MSIHGKALRIPSSSYDNYEEMQMLLFAVETTRCPMLTNESKLCARHTRLILFFSPVVLAHSYLIQLVKTIIKE